MKKEKIIKYIDKTLNDYKMVKIKDIEKERLIFNNEITFETFGSVEKGVLNPFEDYSYVWLSSFFDRVKETLDYKEFDNLDELKTEIEENSIHEWIDNEIDIYTADLLKWLSDSIDNVYYLTEVIEEHDIKDGFELLRIAQYKAIEENFYKSLNILIEHLKEIFEEE